MAPVAEPIVLSSSSDGGGDAMAAGKSPRRSSSAAYKKKTSRKGGEPGEEKTKTKSKKKPSKSNDAVSSSSIAPAAAAAPATTTDCTFPMSRVSRFVRSECGDTRTSPDAIFLINKASEMFLELFVEGAFANAKAGRKNDVSYDHLSLVVHEAKRYDFLSDFIPEKVRAEDALKAMTLVET